MSHNTRMPKAEIRRRDAESDERFNARLRAATVGHHDNCPCCRPATIDEMSASRFMAHKAAYSLVQTINRMETYGGSELDGDDAITTINDLIRESRAILKAELDYQKAGQR